MTGKASLLTAFLLQLAESTEVPEWIATADGGLEASPNLG